MAVESPGCRAVAYCSRRPEQTAPYQVVQQPLETYLALAGARDPSPRTASGQLRHPQVCGPDTVGATGGTFLKAKGIGSKLGLRTMAVRGDDCREVVIDCISEEDIQLPTEFECRSRNDFDVFHGNSELKLVDNAADDPLRQAFDGFPPTPAAADGDASGCGLPRQRAGC